MQKRKIFTSCPYFDFILDIWTFFLEVLRAPCIIDIRDVFHKSNLKMPKRRVPHSLVDARAMLPLLAPYQDGVALGTSVPWKLFCCAVLFSKCLVL